MTSRPRKPKTSPDSARPARVLSRMARWIQSELRDGDASPAPLLGPRERLMAELDRARRYERALTIAVLRTAPANGTNGSRANGSHDDTRRHVTVETELPQVVSLLAAAALQEILRGSDVVCYQHAANRFVLALAEAENHNARKALGRIQSHFRDVLHLDVRASFARFPDDGLTIDDLITNAADRTPDGPLAPTDPPARPTHRRNGAAAPSEPLFTEE